MECCFVCRTDRTVEFTTDLLSHVVLPSFTAAAHHNGLSMNQALLGLSPNIAPGPKEGDLAHDMSHEVKRMHADKGERSSVVKNTAFQNVVSVFSFLLVTVHTI